MTARKFVSCCLPVFLSFTAVLAGCGGSSGGSNGGGGTPGISSVTVACSPGSINSNQTSTCTPTVSGTGSYSSSVTWSVSPASIGTVSSAGVFTPSGTGTATITATSTEDSSKSGNATVTVTAQSSTITSVSVTCSPNSILSTQTSACAATVQGTGSYSSAVTWKATDGAITSAGVFTPVGAGTAVITATSTQDITKLGTASVAVGSASSNNEWVWMGGSSTVSAQGVYGTQGVSAATNFPGARYSPVSWTDQSGNFWLFGGYGYGISGTPGSLNDLWEFTPATDEWTWVSGSSTTGAQGVYGTLGVAAPANVPGARYGSVSWIDSTGDLWLFGGTGAVPPAPPNGSESRNDLWEFNPSTKEWTWVSGSSTVGAQSNYGTLGVAAVTNVPGARYSPVSWTDANGNFWLFGGYSLNDLWKFSPSTKMWIWVSGSNLPFAQGVYGTLGVAAATNVPGARDGSVGWTDQSGDLWLFGGASSQGLFNDLWKYNPTANEWTWESGSNTLNAAGVYGTLGVAAATNVPGARFSSVGWIDGSGTLWLFGGNGISGSSNDLWTFSPTTSQWTWMSGSQTGTAAGIYGTLGVATASNVPGGRMSAVGWIDSTGNLWLFSGLGFDSADAEGPLNDIWRYKP